MDTIKLFMNDVYLHEATAKVLEILPADTPSNGKNGQVKVILDQTIFFPTGGGQSCDLGCINDFRVTDVAEKKGIIYHTLDECDNLSAGDTVTCRLDWERRFDNMQRHCGEHILSGMFFRLYGGINQGFHMGDEYMTIDILLPPDSEHSAVSWDMAIKAEHLANAAIYENAPVVARRYAKQADTAGLPLRKPVTIEEDITVVCVGDIDNPADCVACCGTHPREAGQVGLVKLLKLESYKGMTRVYFEAGRRALLDYDKKHDLITALGTKYSAGPSELPDKIALQEDKNKAVRTELHILKQSVIKARTAAVEAEFDVMASPRDADGRLVIVVKEYDDMKAEDMLSIGRPLMDKIKSLLLIISTHENILLLFSDGSIDCGKLVKENASIYNGKGGGQKNNARALFPNREYLNTFIDLIEKHLR